MIVVTEGLKATFARLEQVGIEYMAVGSIASTVYGDPRLTRDLGVVVRVESSGARLFAAAFAAPEYYLPPEEIVIQELARRGQFNLLHHHSGLKIDVVVQRQTPHGIAEFERRRQIELLPGVRVWMAAPEDVIIAKLRYYREGASDKHLRDISGVLAGTDVDRAYLDSWTKALGLTEQWAKV